MYTLGYAARIKFPSRKSTPKPNHSCHSTIRSSVGDAPASKSDRRLGCLRESQRLSIQRGPCQVEGMNLQTISYRPWLQVLRTHSRAVSGATYDSWNKMSGFDTAEAAFLRIECYIGVQNRWKYLDMRARIGT